VRSTASEIPSTTEVRSSASSAKVAAATTTETGPCTATAKTSASEIAATTEMSTASTAAKMPATSTTKVAATSAEAATSSAAGECRFRNDQHRSAQQNKDLLNRFHDGTNHW
jgi:hypothetical protein